MWKGEGEIKKGGKKKSEIRKQFLDMVEWKIKGTKQKENNFIKVKKKEINFKDNWNGQQKM